MKENAAVPFTPVLDDEERRARRDDAGHRPDGAARVAGAKVISPDAGQRVGVLRRCGAQPSKRIGGPHRAAHRASTSGPSAIGRPGVQERAGRRGRALPARGGQPSTPGARGRADPAPRGWRRRCSRPSAGPHDRARVIGRHYNIARDARRPPPKPPRHHEVIPRRAWPTIASTSTSTPGEVHARDRRERRRQEHADEDPLRVLPRGQPARSASTGTPVRIRSPQDARRLGIGMVFQELVQVPALTRGREHRPVPARSPRGARTAGAGAAHRGDLGALRARRWIADAPAVAALGGRAAARGDRQAAAGRGAHPRPRRADPQPRAPRGRAASSRSSATSAATATPSSSSPTSCRRCSPAPTASR